MSIYARASQAILQSLSTSKNGVITTTYSDDGIVEGIGHTIASTTTLTTGQTLNFLLDLSGLDADKFAFTLPLQVESETHTVQIRVYEGTNYTGGTGVDTFNPNRNASDTTQLVITTGASGASKGDLLITRHAFASKYGASGSSGYSFLILDKTKNYLVELENKGNGDTVVDYQVLLFES